MEEERLKLSENVASLERECEELRARVEQMTDDPTVDYVLIAAKENGIELIYGIKDWDWEGDVYPSISLAEELEGQLRSSRLHTHPDDVAAFRQETLAILAAFEKHVATLKAEIASWPLTPLRAC